jgi:AAA domain
MPRKLFELPELQVIEEKKKRNVQPVDISVFSRDQAEIYHDIAERLNEDGGNVSVIQGFAGHGKTYLVSRILENYIIKRRNRVAFTATTNKAVGVAYKSSEFTDRNLEYATIHKLLNLTEAIKDDGSIYFKPNFKGTPTISEFEVVFIDEASMLNYILWTYLLPYIEQGLKIVFVGDVGQIPPINEGIAVPFQPKLRKQYDMKVYELTTMHRQAAGNPIIQVTEAIRTNFQSTKSVKNLFQYEDMIVKKDKGTFFIDKGDQEDEKYFKALLKHMFTSDNFRQRADFAKLIAWRNKTVDEHNRIIRRFIYGNGKLRRLEPGEKIITKAPVFDGEQIIMPNATELEVMAFERCIEQINGGDYLLPYYQTRVRYFSVRNEECFKAIKILTDLGQIEYNRILQILAEHAKSFTPRTNQFSMAWKDFYDFKKLFAEINYNYCITAHLCQGSTYDNCIVLEEDIRANNRVEERNKILYTAAARPSQRLFIA